MNRNPTVDTERWFMKLKLYPHHQQRPTERKFGWYKEQLHMVCNWPTGGTFTQERVQLGLRFLRKHKSSLAAWSCTSHKHNKSLSPGPWVYSALRSNVAFFPPHIIDFCWTCTLRKENSMWKAGLILHTVTLRVHVIMVRVHSALLLTEQRSTYLFGDELFER